MLVDPPAIPVIGEGVGCWRPQGDAGSVSSNLTTEVPSAGPSAASSAAVGWCPLGARIPMRCADPPLSSDLRTASPISGRVAQSFVALVIAHRHRHGNREGRRRRLGNRTGTSPRKPLVEFRSDQASDRGVWRSGRND